VRIRLKRPDLRNRPEPGALRDTTLEAKRIELRSIRHGGNRVAAWEDRRRVQPQTRFETVTDPLHQRRNVIPEGLERLDRKGAATRLGPGEGDLVDQHHGKPVPAQIECRATTAGSGAHNQYIHLFGHRISREENGLRVF
jgi:hypothetical protein